MAPLDPAAHVPTPTTADEAQAARASREEAALLAEEVRARARAVHEEAARVRAELEQALRETIEAQVAAFEAAREKLLAAMRAAMEQRMAHIEQECAGLVAEMAARVVHRQISADDSIVLDVVRNTLERASGAERITVRVAADDLPQVRAAQAELLAAVAGTAQMEIVSDPAVEPGGCMVETELGHFDARIATQLAALDAEVARFLGGS